MMGENVIMIDKLNFIIGEGVLIRNTLWMLGGQGFRVTTGLLPKIWSSRNESLSVD